MQFLKLNIIVKKNVVPISKFEKGVKTNSFVIVLKSIGIKREDVNLHTNNQKKTSLFSKVF